MINFGNHDLNKNVLIVAEIGNNHEGNINNAKKLIEEAYRAGVDAVKFQTFVPEKYVSINDSNRIKLLKKFQLDRKSIVELSSLATQLGLIFFSTPFQLFFNFRDPRKKKVFLGGSDPKKFHFHETTSGIFNLLCVVLRYEY